MSLSKQPDPIVSGRKGKVYAAFILADDSSTAKPLFAALLQLCLPGPDYNLIKHACEINGLAFHSKKLLLLDQEMRMSELAQQYRWYMRAVEGRYEKEYLTNIGDYPRLSADIISGLVFIETAMSSSILAPDTATKCGLKVSPLSPTEAPNSEGSSVQNSQVPSTHSQAIPQADHDSNNAKVSHLTGIKRQDAGAPDESLDQEKVVAISDDELDANSWGQGYPTIQQAKAIHATDGTPSPAANQLDSISEAMRKSGLHVTFECLGGVAAYEDVVTDQPQQAQDVNAQDPVISAGSTQGSPPCLDDDRCAEDALEQIKASAATIKDDPAVKTMTKALEQLGKSNIKKNRKIDSLIRLNTALEAKLQALLEGEARDITEGLKKTLNDTKKEIFKGFKHEFDEFKSGIIKSNEQSNATVANVAAKVVDLSLSSKEIKKTTNLINQKLAVSGIVVQENPFNQVDIPGILVEINKKINNPFSVPPPTLPSLPPLSTSLQPPACSTNSGIIPPSMVAPVGDFYTPETHRSHGSSSQPVDTPNKQSKWDVGGPSTPAGASNSLPRTKPVSARSLSSQMYSTDGCNSSDNSTLADLMSSAKKRWPEMMGYSQEEIDQRAAMYESELKNKKRHRNE